MTRPDEQKNSELATLDDAAREAEVRDSLTDSWRMHKDAEATEEPADALLGQVVAKRYRIERLIGRGGMGVVYLAEHTELHKRVALKVLHRYMSTNTEVVARFEREAVAAGRLAHPSIVAATDFGLLEDGSFYLALEYIDGKSLAEMLAENGPLEERRALAIAFQINDALCAAHDAGIVHRDLKPDNVLLVSMEDGRDLVKVVDFGIAKLMLDEDHQEGLTRAGLVFGTPEYMSPEQAMGHTVDARSDLYGVGMLLYEMLCGTSPFKAQEVTEMLAKQITEPPPPLPEHVSTRLGALVLWLLQKDPDERPETAQRLAEELCEIAGDLQYSLPPPRTSSGTRAEGSRRPGPRYIQSPPGLGDSMRALSMRPVVVGKSHIPLWIPLLALCIGGALGVFAMLMNEEAVPRRAIVVKQELVDSETQLLVEASAGDRDAIFELRKLTTLVQKELERSGAIAPPHPSVSAENVSPKGQTHGTALPTRETPLETQATASTALETALKGAEEVAADEAVSKQANRYFVLGRGFSIIKHFSAAIEMYREAVRLDPHLSEESELLLDVREAIAARDATDEGLDFALSALGAHGADIIYDVYLDYVGEAGMTPVVARAMKLARSEELLKNATPALRVALRLEQAKYCAEYREIIPDAKEHADDRSLQRLSALQLTRGCGSQANKDCFVCLRRDDVDLEGAVERARTHPSPGFLNPQDEKTPDQ